VVPFGFMVPGFPIGLGVRELPWLAGCRFNNAGPVGVCRIKFAERSGGVGPGVWGRVP